MRRGPRALVLLFLVASLVGGPSLAEPAPVAATGPSVVFTSPASATVLVGSRLRLGWTESALPTAPIVARRIVTFSATVAASGSCTNASFSTLSTNTSSNPPRRYPVTGLVTGRCYYWTVTVTDVNGALGSAKSGMVKVVGGDPSVAFTFPVAGAPSDGPPGAYTISWTGTVSAGVASRSVTEQKAAMGGGRSCDNVTWSTSRTLAPTSASLYVGSLSAGSAGTCYRYLLTVRDAKGRVASGQSGPLLVTNQPPSCAYGAVLTTYRNDADWTRSLLDPIYRLSSTYVPADLRYTSGIYHLSAAFRIRTVAYADLKALADAARAAGATIDLTSTYRSYASQQATYDYYVKALGMSAGLLRAARAGHSEHQLGTTIDVKAYQGPSPQNYTDWTITKTGAWLRDNAWKYGWIMSYPKATSPAVTCYQYEPWHYRYIGRVVAAAVHASGLSLREYLWRHRSLSPGT